MSLTPQIYSSTDSGAPVLSGTAGALTSLLDAILVNGYGSIPAAGWTIAYTATSKRVYRNSPVSGSGYHVRVDDTGATGNARHAWVRGHRTMSDVDTGTADPVPTVAQLANGSMLLKSTLLTSTARAWWAIATEKWIYLFVDCNGGGIDTAVPYFIGDYRSYAPGDGHNFMVYNSGMTTYTGSTSVMASAMFCSGALFGVTAAGSDYNSSAMCGFTPRDKSQAGTSVGLEIMAFGGDQIGVFGSTSLWQFGYPEAVDGGFYYHLPVLKQGALVLRGELPNVVIPLHGVPFSDLAAVSGLSSLPGLSLIAKTFRPNPGQIAGNIGQVLFDLTTDG